MLSEKPLQMKKKRFKMIVLNKRNNIKKLNYQFNILKNSLIPKF